MQLEGEFEDFPDLIFNFKSVSQLSTVVEGVHGNMLNNLITADNINIWYSILDLVGLFIRREKREEDHEKFKKTVTVLHFTDELCQTVSLS